MHVEFGAAKLRREPKVRTNTGIGRFTTRDTYQGDYQYPLTLNRWMYVNGNPILFTDPSGNKCIGPGGSGPCMEYDDIPGYEGYDDYQNVPAYESNPYREFLWRTYGGYNYACPSAFGGGDYMHGGGLGSLGSGYDWLGGWGRPISLYDTSGWTSPYYPYYDSGVQRNIGNHLFEYADAYLDFGISVWNAAHISIKAVDHQYIISGGLQYRSALGMVEKTNIINQANSGRIFSFGDWGNAASQGARGALRNIATWVGVVTDIGQDIYRHQQWRAGHEDGYDGYELGAAIVSDTVANLAVAAVSGAVAGSVTAGLTGIFAAAGVATVATIAAPVIAIGAGIVAGAALSYGLKYGYDNVIKEPLVDAIAGIFKPKH